MPIGILLDADVPPAGKTALDQQGHDVVAASGNPLLEELTDDELLREAGRQRRVLVSFNVHDFVEAAHRSAHLQDDHHGIIVIHSRSFPRTDIGAIAEALDTLVQSRETFENALLFLQRAAG